MGLLRSTLIISILWSFASFTPLSALARVDGFLVWQPEAGGVKYVIPKISGESPDDFVKRYQRLLRASPVYGGMDNAQSVNFDTPLNAFSEMPVSTSDHANVQVVLNKPSQMTDKNPYLKKVLASFEREGNRLFAIPVGMETALSPADMRQFREALNKMDGQLGVGGDDAHPATFGSSDTRHTIGDISEERDIQQTAYMKEYLANGKGRVFYVCGSMQRAAIADGHAFHSDIHAAGLTDVAQRAANGPVLLEVTADANSELAIAAGSTRFLTSNYHHGGVDDSGAQPGRSPKSTISAYNVEADGSRGRVVKSIEFSDNRGFATQFHPEFRGSLEENNIVRYVSAGWKMRGRYAPKAVLSCMRKSLKAMVDDWPAEAGSAP